jgi:phospholipid/cholesterol/gamma-HCH transport system substrate-binding protein
MRRLALIICALAGGTGLLLAGSAASDDGGPYEVRAIFDNASFLVQGEEVRVAGAKVGEITEVDVTRPGETASSEGGGKAVPGKAAVVMRIDDPGFQDFREDASCLIQPQSLLGEKFVGCEVTQPRAPGTEPPPPLEEVPDGQPGEGQMLLPLENNGKAVDLDLVNNIMREPYADRFRLILNDLGAGLAARGDDLDAIVERANPALRETDRVLAILAEQNRVLANLARDSDTVLAPLARERRNVTGFIRGASETAQATAERSGDLEAGLERFPAYLRELRLTSIELRRFSDAGTPVVSDVGAAAPSLTRAQRALGPLAKAGIPALRTLGDAAEESEENIVASDPVIKDIRDLARSAKPGANQLNELLRSLSDTGGIEALMDFVFNTSAGVNGFDEYGTYLRTFALITNCTRVIATPVLGCSAQFTGEDDASTASVAELLELLGGEEPGNEEPGKRRSREGSTGGAQSPSEQPQPAPQPAPSEPQPPAEEGQQQNQLAPEPEATSSRRSARGGRALFRFLLEDGR